MKILLLEDDLSLNKAIKKILERNGHEVVSFFDGEDVLNLFDEIDSLDYDLFIFDINVPNISGLDLLNSLYVYNQNIKVIIISANSDEQSLKKAYEFGCMDYINKPFHLVELEIKIDKIYKSLNSSFTKIKLKENQSLTKKEKLFLSLLIENKIVTYEIIENTLYQSKTMTMDALRALVKRLRAKMQDDLIVNVLDEGYSLKHRV